MPLFCFSETWGIHSRCHLHLSQLHSGEKNYQRSWTYIILLNFPTTFVYLKFSHVLIFKLFGTQGKVDFHPRNIGISISIETIVFQRSGIGSSNKVISTCGTSQDFCFCGNVLFSAWWEAAGLWSWCAHVVLCFAHLAPNPCAFRLQWAKAAVPYFLLFYLFLPETAICLVSSCAHRYSLFCSFISGPHFKYPRLCAQTHK